MEQETVKTLYRYDDSATTQSAGIFLDRVIVVKETPRGYWYADALCAPKETWRWVSNDGRRRRYYPTKELAWKSYRIRKGKQMQHLRHALRMTKIRHDYAHAHEAPPEETFTTAGSHGMLEFEV